MKGLINLLLRLLALRMRRTFFVYGMRRAGNHACVGWLANAMEGEAVTFFTSQHSPHFNFSNTGRTVFINEVNRISCALYRREIRKHLKKIRRAEFIIFSAEDKGAYFANNWRIPNHAEKICVRRGALNLLASRFHNINKKARQGLGHQGQSMDSYFFKILEVNKQFPQGVIWDFEYWCSDKDWRLQFLNNIGLHFDSVPSISNEGGGSSFSGNHSTPSPEELKARYAMVEPAHAWKEFLKTVSGNYPDIFSAAELQLIKEILY